MNENSNVARGWKNLSFFSVLYKYLNIIVGRLCVHWRFYQEFFR